MAYEQDSGGSAADALEPQEGAEPQEQSEQAESVYLPDFPGAESLKSGDVVSFRIIGRAGDGSLEAEPVSGEQDQKAPGMMENFDKEVS